MTSRADGVYRLIWEKHDLDNRHFSAIRYRIPLKEIPHGYRQHYVTAQQPPVLYK